uniref:Uncharacterized protein n=1 Tax=Heliothis virescens TaxID=7102 RepID=A0A2A4JU17_HELVI
MNLKYLFLLITLKNINCYNPKRHTLSPKNLNNSKTNTSNPVIPARYKITSKANYEDPTVQNFQSEYFPEVEYPESIVDSSKPFYISASPFPREVKSTFNTLAAQRNSKVNPITDYSWIHNDKSKENIPPPEQKVGVNEVTDTKGNEINSDDKSTNETLAEDIAILDIEDETANYTIPYIDNDMDRLFINWTLSDQSSECPELDYVVGFIDDLDKFMRNLTGSETANEGDNSTLHAVESERPDEIQSVELAPTNYNESGTELNGIPFLQMNDPNK